MAPPRRTRVPESVGVSGLAVLLASMLAFGGGPLPAGAATTTAAPPGAASTDPGPLPPRSGPPSLPGSPAPPPDLQLPDPTPRIRVLASELSIMDIQVRQASARSTLASAAGDEQRARAHLASADAVVADARHGVDVSRVRLGNVAVVAYMGAGDAGLSSEVAGDTTAGLRRHELVTVSLERGLKDVRDARQGLVGSQVARREAQLVVDAAAAKVNDARTHLDSVDADMARARGEAAAARAGASGSALTIGGGSLVTPEELQAWFVAQMHPSKANAPVADLAAWFVAEGQIEGIRGDMAFAQAVLETGYFSNADTVGANNFAGIGHCDSCRSGFVFADPHSGVRAQIQLLKSYAEANPTYANPLVDGRLRGPAGCCRNWDDLTHVWASDPNYGRVILGIYEKVLTYAVQTRSANGGRPPARAGVTQPGATR